MMTFPCVYWDVSQPHSSRVISDAISCQDSEPSYPAYNIAHTHERHCVAQHEPLETFNAHFHSLKIMGSYLIAVLHYNG